MGSKKNKGNKKKNSYRHVYVKKWPAKAKRIHTTMTGADKNRNQVCPEGNRIVNFKSILTG